MSSLPKAFHVGRVTEALQSLTHYVEEARKIANEIKPLRTTTAQVNPTVVVGNPELTSITPNTICIGKTSITVHGKNLNNVKEFGLIFAENLSKLLGDKFWGVTTQTNGDLKVDVSLGAEAPAGTYHAWVRDSDGQEALLENALTIEIKPNRPDKGPTAT